MLRAARTTADRVRARLRGPAEPDAPRPLRYRRSWEPSRQRKPTFPGLISQACTQSQIESPAFQALAVALDDRALMHRKQWEWCYIVQALAERGMLQEGKRGLGFGVGTEPITAYAAARGCEIVATDLPDEADGSAHWVTGEQHASRLEDCNDRGLCDPEVFRRRVSFRPVDMRAIPEDLSGFDFTWSSCAMEHLGSIDATLRFFEEQIARLNAGGVGVHTTEFNVSSNDETIAEGPTVVLRRLDIEHLVERTVAAGHEMEVTFALGRGRHDRHVDRPPFTNSHLKVELDGFVITSFGLIVTKRAG